MAGCDWGAGCGWKKPSEYLYETAKKNIDGEILVDGAGDLLVGIFRWIYNPLITLTIFVQM